MMEIEQTIRKIGAEVDVDILEWMLAVPVGNKFEEPNHYFLHHPVDNMLEWQKLRDRKKERAKKHD